MDLTNDTHFASLNRTCMQFSRSAHTCRSPTAWAENFLGVTAFVDASTVYGSESARAMLLRGGEARRKNGRLWTSERLKDFKVPQRADLCEC